MKPAVVLVTLFEPPEAPGEFALFREGFALRPLEKAGPLRLFADREGSVLALVAGVGPVQTAAAVTAVGLDARFDLSEALWIVAGIAGGDPAVVPLGSPVWADWCVDGDLAWEIDAREIPPGWSTGILPLGAREPFGPSAGEDGAFGPRYESFRLPPGPLAWALERTGGLELRRSEEARAEGRRYGGAASAADPCVLRGATLSAARFWHGSRMNEWARRWVDHHTEGRGRFHTSNMEDSGTLHALRLLGRLGRADPGQVLVLRTVSNFTRPPDGAPAVATLLAADESSEVSFPGLPLALENGYRAAAEIIRRRRAGERPPPVA